MVRFMIEEVLSFRCQVLSRAGRAGSLPRPLTSNFTLYTSNSADGRLYKQTQFPGLAVFGWPAPPGAPARAYKQTQFPRLRISDSRFKTDLRDAPCGLPGPRAGCTNKPNWSERSVRNKPNLHPQRRIGGASGTPNAICRVWEPDPPYRACNCTKQTQFPGGAGRDEASGTVPGRLVQTKPIPGVVGRERPTHALALRAGSTKSQSCQTKPIRRNELRQTNPIRTGAM